MRQLPLLLLFAAATAGAQELSVTPRAASIDTRVLVSARGLQPGQAAIIRASTRDADGTEWQAWAGFKADDKGSIDVSSRAPEHGSYSGVDAMGLFWSMEVTGEHYGRRRFNLAGMREVNVKFDLEVAGSSVHSVVAVREIVPRDVLRSDIRESGLVGTLFVPDAPRGAIVVLGGSEGGIGDETVAALLARHGYVTLALAYFGEASLPETLSEVPLETFFAGIDYLETRISRAFERIAIVGTSKGAEAALVVASHRKDITAVVAYAPSSVVWSCICDAPRSSWSLGGQPVPFVPPGRDPAYAPPRGFPLQPAVHYAYRLSDAPGPAHIAVERIAAHLLLIAGADDRMWPSAEMARQIAERRTRTATAVRDELLIIPNAGHLLNKTYIPAGSTRTGNGRLDTGGTSGANGQSTSVVWPAVVAFLDKHSSQ